MGQIIREYNKAKVLMSFDYKLSKIYKVNFIVNIIKKYIFLIVNISIWSYFSNDIIETSLYFLFIQLFSSFFSSDVAEKLSYSINSGTIGNEMALPIDLRKKFLYESFGMLKFNFIYSFIPTIVIIITFFQLNQIDNIQVNPMIILLLTINVIITYGIIYLIELCIGLVAIKTVYAWGIINLKNSLMLLLSGSVIPLYVFSDTFLGIYKYTFFYNIYYFNIELIYNQLSVSDALLSVLLQFSWLVIIFIFQNYLYRKAIVILEVGGG